MIGVISTRVRLLADALFAGAKSVSAGHIRCAARALVLVSHDSLLYVSSLVPAYPSLSMWGRSHSSLVEQTRVLGLASLLIVMRHSARGATCNLFDHIHLRGGTATGALGHHVEDAHSLHLNRVHSVTFFLVLV